MGPVQFFIQVAQIIKDGLDLNNIPTIEVSDKHRYKIKRPLQTIWTLWVTFKVNKLQQKLSLFLSNKFVNL